MQKIELWVFTSDDGETRFTEVADILNTLGHRYEAIGHADLAGFCFTRASEARCIDRVHEQKETPWQEPL